jgi:hypothetical protein
MPRSVTVLSDHPLDKTLIFSINCAPSHGEARLHRLRCAEMRVLCTQSRLVSSGWFSVRFAPKGGHSSTC